jgi:hypothetical protein
MKQQPWLFSCFLMTHPMLPAVSMLWMAGSLNTDPSAKSMILCRTIIAKLKIGGTPFMCFHV